MTKNIASSNELYPNRTYKARIFEMIFSDKNELLELYNAVNGTHYDNPDYLVVNTLENAIYMSMHNDISFIIDLRLNLYEHQSTCNPNLPLRFLMYVADIYSKLTKDKNLYGTKAVRIPPPQFVIFYNGKEDLPDRKCLSLSELFTIPEEVPALELTATILNINKGKNKKLMDSCKTLKDYAEYTYWVRTYAEELPIEDAVERAITECIREGILSDFLSRNRAEAKKVSIYEYDQEKHLRQTRQEGWEDGWKAGQEDGLLEGKIRGYAELVRDGVLSISDAARRLNMQEEELKKYL